MPREPQRRARLLNCLQTILDLESQLRSIRETKSILKELTSLRNIMHDLNLKQVRLEEDDVCRIESATKAFLKELEIHFTQYDQKTVHHGTLQ